MKLIRSITPEVKIIDARLGLVDYVASDETVDCYREIIKASGWKFTHFKKNAPFVDSHNYGCISKLLGKVVDFRVESKQLIERVQWAADIAENAMAQLGWKLTLGGYLKAVSVGFFPTKSVSRWDSDATGYQAALKEAGVDPGKTQVDRVFLEQEQIELSACIIGANPNALAKAHQDGAVKDADLAAVGFSDQGMQLLHDAAKVHDQSDAVTRAAIDLLLQRSINLPGKGTPPAPPANAPLGADDADREERDAFLAEFKKLTGHAG